MAIETRIRLSVDDRQRLKEIGLSEVQVRRLDLALPGVAAWLSVRATSEDVRGQLAVLKGHAAGIEQWIEEALALRTAHHPKRVAAGNLGVFVATRLHGLARDFVDPADEHPEDSVPRRFDFAVLARALRIATAETMKEFSGKRSKAAKVPAISRIVDALGADWDVKVSRAPGAPFLEVAEVVFAAARRASGGTAGPESAIRHYLAQKKAATRRSAGE